MKTFFSVFLFQFSLISFVYAGEAFSPNEQTCVSGPIDTYTYHENNISVHVRGYNFSLQTSNAPSFPLITSAYINRMNVVIYTDSCKDEVKFTKIKFHSLKN